MREELIKRRGPIFLRAGYDFGQFGEELFQELLNARLDFGSLDVLPVSEGKAEVVGFDLSLKQWLLPLLRVEENELIYVPSEEELGAGFGSLAGGLFNEREGERNSGLQACPVTLLRLLTGDYPWCHKR